jgi:hypothetical protein
MTTRIVWLFSGLAWAARSLLELARPNYYEPTTLLDWSAVATYSLAWLLSAAAVLLLTRDSGSAGVRTIGIIFMIAAIVAGLSNAIEDALDLAWGGLPYIAGFLIAWLSLVPMAVLMWRAGDRRGAALPLALFASVALFNAGGGIVVLVVGAAFAAWPSLFAGGDRPGGPRRLA